MTSLLRPSGSTRAWRALRLAVLDRDGWACRVPKPDGTPCLRPASHVDHLISRAMGGGDAEGNLRAACKACNLRRGDGQGLQPARAWTW